jgi:hypothetical protein
MGYHGQLIKQSQITVRGRQSIDLNLARETQTHGRLPPKGQLSQAVPVDLRLGSGTYIPWYKVLLDRPHMNVQTHAGTTLL